MQTRRMFMSGFPVPIILIIVLLFAGRVLAKDDNIVARVDGQPVYEWELALAGDEVGDELAGVGKEQRRSILLRYVVDSRLMAKAGRAEGLEKQEAFKRRMQYARARALRDAWFALKIRDAITDRQLRDIYEKEISKFKPQEEVRARHILVAKEEDALDIIERLNRGDDFIALANEKSIGPSGRNGGDLGYFTRGRMAKSFEDAAFALKPGEISEPVKSNFGWHVIKVEVKRMSKAPAFEEMKDRIRARLVQQKSREVTGELRRKAKIEILDKALAKSMNDIE